MKKNWNYERYQIGYKTTINQLYNQACRLAHDNGDTEK